MKTILFTILSFLFVSTSFGEDQIQPELYIFIGEKIKVNEIAKPGIIDKSAEEITFSMNYVFKAKYKVLENIYGDLKTDTIEFTAYDHYGTPAFSKYKYVLLYVAKYGDEFYHEKYQYSALYKTKSNKWAGIYSATDYNYNISLGIKSTIVPVKIDFEPEVVIDIKKYDAETIKEWFPEPYFKIKKNKAIAVYGNYIEELIQLKKDGVLGARGYFK